MATIQSLEREIQSLQNQLKQQNREAEQARQRLTEENQRRLREYQREMQQAIRNHDRETQAKYERLLAEYQSGLNADVRARLTQTDGDYQRLLESVKKSEAALLRKNRELEQAIESLKKDAARRGEGSAEEAWSYLQSAANAVHSVQAKPHEKFMPKRLDICLNALKDGNRLFGAGMYEAASAVAISSESALERLSVSLDDKISEWDEQYALFCLKLSCLETKIEQELSDWGAFTRPSEDGGSTDKNDCFVEINYWSRGAFEQVMRVADQCARVRSDVERAGKDAYLRRPDGASTDDWKQYLTEIDQADGRLAALSGVSRQRYAASCQRAEWGEAIVNFLTDEINLEWLDGLSGYKAASAETMASKEYADYMRLQFGDEAANEDMREWLRLVFENASGNRIYLYMLPMENGGKVANRILLHIDYGGAEQALYSRDIYRHLCEAIGLDEEDGIVNYAPDTGALKASRNRLYSETGRDIEQCVMRNS